MDLTNRFQFNGHDVIVWTEIDEKLASGFAFEEDGTITASLDVREFPGQCIAEMTRSAISQMLLGRRGASQTEVSAMLVSQGFVCRCWGDER